MKSIPFLFVLLPMIGCGGPAKRCLVSPLSGTIVANGKPVDGATVTRNYHSHWYKEDVETVTHTDANGNFEFDGAWKNAAVDVLHQPVVEEQIVVEHKGKTYTVFVVTKMNYECFGELSARGLRDPKDGKDRLSKQNEKLYLKYDLESDKIPIGRLQ
jgi:hypothetical protein